MGVLWRTWFDALTIVISEKYDGSIHKNSAYTPRTRYFIHNVSLSTQVY